MIPLQNDQVQILLAPQQVTADGTNTSGVADMSGYGAAHVILSVASSTTTALPINITLQESNDLTTYTTIVSAGTASTGWKTQITNATAVSSVTAPWAMWNIQWTSARKRYLRATITGATTGTYTAALFVVKSRAAQSPTGTNVGGTYISTSVGSTYVVNT